MLNLIALKLPGDSTISSPPEVVKRGFVDLASFINPLLNVLFYIAVFMAFSWMAWGALAYIMAQGKKEDLAKARARILWALIGLSITLMAFFAAKFVGEFFKPGIGGVPF